jgi:biopolymer transport protein ExbD
MYQDVGDPNPIGDINTTPLVDVMLVLLIMFIITIPMQTHAVKLDLPSGPPPDFVVDRVKNRVVISESGGLLWNGRPASDEQYRALLSATQRLADEPELQLQPDALARYERVDEVLAVTKRARVTRLGFVGNELYGRF